MPKLRRAASSTRRTLNVDRPLRAVAPAHPDDRGGWGIGNIGPDARGHGRVVPGHGASLLLVARLIGERAP